MQKYSFEAGIFDMDGVITKTAIVHSDAWKLVFDEYLHIIEKKEDKPFQEFSHQDYLNFVDGKPRLKGIASFLSSRGMIIPLGTDQDKLPQETIHAIGNTKNDKFQSVLNEKGVQVYEPTIALIKDLKLNGIKVGVVSSSKNCEFVLRAAGVLELFDTRVDGVIAQELGLEGKPEGDIFIKAAENLLTTPDKSIVFEDAISGVQSGRNGSFGLVVGIARSDNMAELNENGADFVVDSLSRLSLEDMDKWFIKRPVSLLKNWDTVDNTNNIGFLKQANLQLKINSVYLSSFQAIWRKADNNLLFLSEEFAGKENLKDKLEILSKENIIIVYGNKDCKEISENIGIKTVHYLGENGFTIFGENETVVEIKEKDNINDKGQLVRWFLRAAEISWLGSDVIYIGSKQIDENAFRVVNTRGIGVLVCEESKISSAQFKLNSVEQLEEMLSKLNGLM